MIEPVDLEFFSMRSQTVTHLYKARRFGNAGFDKEFISELRSSYSIDTEPKDLSPLRYLWELVLQMILIE